MNLPITAPAGNISIGEPTFADLIAAIASSDSLSAEHRVHWATSLRQMAGYLDRPTSTLPARISAISGAVRRLHPQQLGVNAKTFANHRANVRSALLWANRQSEGDGRKAPMAVAYRDLLDGVENRHVKDVLSPLFRFLSAFGIRPKDVSDAQVDDFISSRKLTGFAVVTLGAHRSLVRHWNACASSVEGWPQVILAEPELPQRFKGPGWDDFPTGLRADIDAYCARLSKRRKGSGGQILRPCTPSTIATRRRELIAAVRAAVMTGVRLHDLGSLRELLRPDRVKAIIEHYWKRNGEEPAHYTIDLGWKMLALARNEPDMCDEEIERLEEIYSTLEVHRKNGLTEKNRALIRQVIQSDVWSKVVELPQRLMASASADAGNRPAKSAVAAAVAVAIRLLVIAPVRAGNLASIRLGLNLVRPGGRDAPFLLTFPDYDVKNRLPLEFPLDETTSRMIDEYILRHRPFLMRGRNHDALFPGAVRDQKSPQDLSDAISRMLWKLLGLRITAHQFRHAAAAIILRSEPGNYELVRRVLGHRNIQTTTAFYVGLEMIAAAQRFGEIVMATSPAPEGAEMTDGNRVEALRVQNWPAADRGAWLAACRPPARLRLAGVAGGMKASTQTSLVRAYGNFLEHCERTGVLDLAAQPAAHVTTTLVSKFLIELAERVSSVTRWSYISKIRRVANILAPTGDFGWLREMELDLAFDARPRPKYSRIVDAGRLMSVGLDLVERGETSIDLTNLQRARLVRDGLMVALLSLCPIRLRNLHALALGRQIRRVGNEWWIVLEAQETKSNRPDERPIPEILTPIIERWISYWRPFFLDPGDAFWASTKGGSLAYTYVGTLITELTRRELGAAVNPHLFRDCAVQTVAHAAGDQMGIASGVLQHFDPRVTEKYYNKGASHAAAKTYQDILLKRRNDEILPRR